MTNQATPIMRTGDHTQTPVYRDPSIRAPDDESAACLSQMAEQEQVHLQKIEGVKFVLVVLSARGMAYDVSALRQKILLSYPDSLVFLRSTGGTPLGPECPAKVDLLIDFTGPGQRQGWLYARKLRAMAKYAVGRNAGMFRRRIYDQVLDEQGNPEVPTELLARERYVQKKLLNMAGVASFHAGVSPSDRGKSIALELPSMRKP
jgi:hypothetical protein